MVSVAHGKALCRRCRAPGLDDDGELDDGGGACRRDRHAGLGHDALQAREARGLAHVLRQQAVPLLHRPLELAEAQPEARIEARDDAVEEAAALGGRPGEKAVHRRRQPEDVDQVGERAGAGPGLAVDAHAAARARAVLALQAGADPGAAQRGTHGGGDGPVRGADAGQLRVGRPAQTLAGGQQRDSLDEVGLARAVGTDEHDRAGAGRQRQPRVVPEVGEPQLLDPHARAGGAGRGRRGAGGRNIGGEHESSPAARLRRAWASARRARLRRRRPSPWSASRRRRAGNAPSRPRSGRRYRGDTSR